jgi:NADH-quinone oxidoreductase subunit L
MRVTFWTFLIGSAALAGVPPLAGFWSKDELLVGASHGHEVLFVVMALTALVTAFYTTRMVLQTFFGGYRGHGHPHESPLSITGPLVALAAATVFVGWLGAGPVGAAFFDWVFFEEPEEIHFVAWVAALSVGAVALGAGGGFALYRRWRDRDPIRSLGPAYTLLENKYYLDDIYWKGIIRPIRDPVAAFVYWTNQTLLDGVVNGAGSITKAFSRVIAWFDRTVIDGAVNGAAHIAGFTGGILRYVQSGNVQRYAVLLFTGVLVLTVIFTRI